MVASRRFLSPMARAFSLNSSERIIARWCWKDLDDLVIERPCLEIIQNSEVIDQIQIINGLKEGKITKVLRGEHVGTIIRKS
jgi:molybdenum storage protein